MKKIILGFTGLMASGKDTCADYLENKYGGKNYSFSTMLADVLKRYHLEINRDNLIKISEAMRTTFGEDILAKTMAYDLEKDDHKIVSTSNVRRMADIKYLSKLPNFVLVTIEADPKIRYERLVKRGQRSDEFNKTYEEFLADHKRSTEITIIDTMAQATEKIDNNGNIEELYSQVDAILKKYQ
ncbi:MAG: AAA family ATPase [Patescibacteria group bacterium]